MIFSRRRRGPLQRRRLLALFATDRWRALGMARPRSQRGSRPAVDCRSATGSRHRVRRALPSLSGEGMWTRRIETPAVVEDILAGRYESSRCAEQIRVHAWRAPSGGMRSRARLSWPAMPMATKRNAAIDRCYVAIPIARSEGSGAWKRSSTKGVLSARWGTEPQVAGMSGVTRKAVALRLSNPFGVIGLPMQRLATSGSCR